ncbi:MAG: hypothetical protein NTU98_00840 [Bacteroidetes bacterium]|nr:hypothetical protein [Bacteroidota bacterium]
MNRDKKSLIAGYIMAICGFICILITALNYLFRWKMGIPPAALGIVFLGVGMVWIKRSRERLKKP